MSVESEVIELIEEHAWGYVEDNVVQAIEDETQNREEAEEVSEAVHSLLLEFENAYPDTLCRTGRMFEKAVQLVVEAELEKRDESAPHRPLSDDRRFSTDIRGGSVIVTILHQHITTFITASEARQLSSELLGLSVRAEQHLANGGE